MNWLDFNGTLKEKAISFLGRGSCNVWLNPAAYTVMNQDFHLCMAMPFKGSEISTCQGLPPKNTVPRIFTALIPSNKVLSKLS